MRSAAKVSRLIGLIGIVGAALAATAEPELGQPFEMRPAEVVTIQRVRITFDNVSDDSRCPAGASCMWAGDAAAAFTLETPPSAALHRTLHTNGRFERETEYGGLVVRLEDVEPHPKEGATIRPDDYRATLVVTKR
jgi:hypothetical protein